MNRSRNLIAALFVSLALVSAASAQKSKSDDLSRQVEIIRTAYGVPHIRAENLRAAGYALAWLQCEDYGTRMPMDLVRARGRWASMEGAQWVDADFQTLRYRARTLKKYPTLSRDVREVYEGFARGVNRYIETHRADFPASMPADFTGEDVAATEIIAPTARKVRNFLNRLNEAANPDTRAGKDFSPQRRRDAESANEHLSADDSKVTQAGLCPNLSRRLCTSAVGRAGDSPPRRGDAEILEGVVAENELTSGDEGFCPSLSPRLCVSAVKNKDEGSNTWAFGPSRTKSGRAILMRNPHLQWTAGYYEAQMTVPGIVDFYGDFRIGGPFAVIGGFNKHLGWSTTNNNQDLDQIYSLEADPKNLDHYLLDGKSHALTKDVVTVQSRSGETLASETREYWSTRFGPVIHRTTDKIYVFKYAGDGELRNGEQFLRMMRAKSLKDWKNAMRMRARLTSNFTYADALGNIFFIWNATLPLLPHPVTDDTVAIAVKNTSEMWTTFVPFDSLPQFLNPAGGYIHNENDSPHFTNIRTPVKTANAYPNFEAPDLSLRSQLALQLIGGDEKLDLDDVWRLKHNYRMLAADRVKPDLLAAVKATNPTGDVADAIALLERWDNTASPESRGSVIFSEWWATYSGLRRPQPQMIPNDRRYAKVWSVTDPLNTPQGLADLPRAVESFTNAVAEVKRRFGAIDVMWGDVHRVRRGGVDVPVGGCGNDLGCFRTLGYTRADDGKSVASVGDGWVFAVEFGTTPRAYSVLAYGQSPLPTSPYHADQAEMFAKGGRKTIAFTKEDIDRQAVKRYRPGGK